MKTINVSGDSAVKAADAAVPVLIAKHQEAWDAHARAQSRGEFTEDLWAAKIAAQDELQKAMDARANIRGDVGMRLFREDKNVLQALRTAADATAQAARAWDAVRDIAVAYQAAGAPVPDLAPPAMPTARGPMLQTIIGLCEKSGIPLPAYFAEEVAKQAEEGARMTEYLKSAQWGARSEAPTRVVGAGTHD